MIENVGHNRVPITAVRVTELLILKFLNFRVNFTTCYEFLTILGVEFKIPSPILETAKIICYYSQIFYAQLEFKASQVGYSALIIASTSINQHGLATKLIEKYKDAELLNIAIKKIRTDIYDLPRLKHLYGTAMKFLRFELVLKKPGPLFRFLNKDLEKEQGFLLSNPN